MADNNGNGFSIIEVRSNALNLFGKDGNLLVVSYLDDSISLSIRPPYEDGTGKKTFPRENGIPIILRRDVVLDLSYIIEKSILPAYESGQDFSKGVFLTGKKDSILAFESENGIISMHYYKDIDESRKPKSNVSFVFQLSTTLDKYNSNTGDFELEELQSQFYCFAHMIMNFERVASTKIIAHGAKAGVAWNAKQEMEHLRAIASKLGASVEGATYYNNQRSNNSGNWNAPNQTAGNDFTNVQMNQVDNLEKVFY